jgi:formate hydrogenlyase transcriptional activator
MARPHDHHRHPIPNPLGEHASARGTAIASPRKELAVSPAGLSTGPLSLVERFQTLLAVAGSITSCRDPEELFRRLARQLQRVIRFDRLGLVLLQPERGVTSARVLETTGTGFTTLPEYPLHGSHSGWVIETQQALIVPDTEAETRWPRAMAELQQHGIVSFCSLPLTTARRRIGALGCGSREPVMYTAAEVDFLGEVAKLVAVAVDNALNFDDAQATQRQLSTERDHLRLLLEVTNALVSNLDLAGLVAAISSSLERAIPHEFTTLALYDKESDDLVVHAAAAKSSDGRRQVGRRIPVRGSATGEAFTARRTLLFGEDDLTGRFADTAAPMREAGIRSVCAVPLVVGDRGLGTLTVGNPEPDAFTPESVAMIEAVARQVAMAVANCLAFQEIAQLTQKLAEERLYLESEIRAEHPFGEIVGESRPLRDVLQQVETVAPTDATVLVLGETGTGKELIARAIHDRSGRRERTFVKINCAAIPSGLLESELFGHERGAFTGAIAQKIGRFEVAQGGTLFLDEVGEIPLDLQPKLLRVLQEQEFERLGGTRTIKVDVRLVAATNRDLARLVEEQRFRDDLYYRLNVFPIHVPSLRERPEDIPALVRFFVQRLARPMNRHVEVIPSETLDALRRYAWPGNVRELANLIERAMILSKRRTLEVPLAELERRRPPTGHDDGATTLEGVERMHVLHVLQETNWVLGGPRGAAARLGLKRTTLQSLMGRLGITRPGAA